MMDFIIDIIIVLIGALILGVGDYFGNNESLKGSLRSGLFGGMLGVAVIAAGPTPSIYQLIIVSIVLGVTIFLSEIIYEYCICRQPLNESISEGLAAGAALAVIFLIFMMLYDFITWMI